MYNCLASRYAFVPHRAGLESKIVSFFSIKLKKYIEAGVREYWLVDQENRKVIVYLLENDINTFLYTFDDKIPVAIWDNECYVDMQEIQEELNFLYE